MTLTHAEVYNDFHKIIVGFGIENILIYKIHQKLALFCDASMVSNLGRAGKSPSKPILKNAITMSSNGS